MAPSADFALNHPAAETHSDDSERIVGAGRLAEDQLDWLENQSRGRRSHCARGRGTFVGLSLVSAAGAVVRLLALAA